MSRAFITGATGVLGSAYSFSLAKKGYDLFLTGRSTEKLCALKNKLTAEYPSVNINFYACDLCASHEREALFNAAGEYTFDLVINCAGADVQKPFEKYDEQKIVFQIRANFESAVSVTRFAIAHREKTQHILNVSSVCGLRPMPNFAIYSASKAALNCFSLAISEELKKSGVTVTSAICGSVYTRPDVCENIAKQGKFARLSAKQPQWIVVKSLKAAVKGKRKVILGFWNKALNFCLKFVPLSVQLKFIKKRWARLEKDAF